MSPHTITRLVSWTFKRARLINQAAKGRPEDTRSMPELAGASHRWVQSARVRLHVAELGSGPPVLLIHGWPSHWWCWRGVIPALAKNHRVIAVDLLGFGWSDVPAGGYDKATLADDIAALLDALELERVFVLAHGVVSSAFICACVILSVSSVT